MAKYELDPISGTITVTMSAAEATEIAEANPYGAVALNIPVWISTLELHMREASKRCPGSGQPGVVNGALLHCQQCNRLIGVVQVNKDEQVLPEHERPVFDNGRERI